jgi:hypothetical protein
MDSRPRPSVAAPPGLPPGVASDVVEETVLLPGRGEQDPLGSVSVAQAATS